jgi:hypothetical protein
VRPVRPRRSCHPADEGQSGPTGPRGCGVPDSELSRRREPCPSTGENPALAAALGGSTADGQADTVTVAGTKGDDSIAVDANGAAVDVSGLAAFVWITHADPASDRLIIDKVAGADDVSLDPALAALIQVSVQ